MSTVICTMYIKHKKKKLKVFYKSNNAYRQDSIPLRLQLKKILNLVYNVVIHKLSRLYSYRINKNCLQDIFNLHQTVVIRIRRLRYIIYFYN